jgi:hypothetical protein
VSVAVVYFFRRQERLADPSGSGEKLDSLLTGVGTIGFKWTESGARVLGGRRQ